MWASQSSSRRTAPPASPPRRARPLPELAGTPPSARARMRARTLSDASAHRARHETRSAAPIQPIHPRVVRSCFARCNTTDTSKESILPSYTATVWDRPFRTGGMPEIYDTPPLVFYRNKERFPQRGIKGHRFLSRDQAVADEQKHSLWRAFVWCGGRL